MKIVINGDYGGFGLSNEAFREFIELETGLDTTFKLTGSVWNTAEFFCKNEDDVIERCTISQYDICRHNKNLVHVVEKYGDEASSNFASLKVVEITGTKYVIDEYDGYESVITPENINWIDASEDEEGKEC